MAFLYVNGATGNDATLKASNSQLTPWATLGRALWGSTNRAIPNAAQAATAGDIVIVEAGVYTETSSFGLGKEDPLLTPVNNGAAGNPLTIQANGEVSFILPAYSGPQIGSYQRDYIVWDGFTINENQGNSTADTGPVVLWDCENCTIKNCVINGTEVAFNDNHCGIRIEQSNQILIQNCFIQNIRDSLQNGENSAGIMLYTSSNVIIEKCSLTGSDNGIFVKGSNVGPITIRHNLIYTQSYGLYLAGINASLGVSQACKCYENIIYDVEAGIVIKSYDAISPNHLYIINNTVLANDTVLNAPLRFSGGNITGLTNSVISGNIFVDGYNNIEGNDQDGTAFAAKVGPSGSDCVSEHNVYFSASNQFSRVGNTNRTFATWKIFTGSDLASPVSIESDPLFVNQATRDFRLQGGSPARMAVPDLGGIYSGATKDAGARQFADNSDPTQIGYVAGSEPEPPPVGVSMRYARLRSR